MLDTLHARQQQLNSNGSGNGNGNDGSGNGNEETSAKIRMISGAVAGCTACVACYPLDLIRTRLTTELPGREHYKGITDACTKIIEIEGIQGLYAGIGPTLFVAVPNFAISYTVYGTLKEYVLDDDLFYNLRKVDLSSGEESLGFKLSLLCGAASGTLSTLVTFPFDTIRRRMQIQNLHVEEGKRLNGFQEIKLLLKREGHRGLYRGLTPELLKVIPMVGTMFTVYEFLKQQLNIKASR
jgi:solute carrier family 25 phosphate transporter 23/24/25/41